jgi:hypothetical protein
MIPNLTVVGDVAIGHEVIVISYDGLSPALHRASMKSDKLPHDIMIPDLQEGGLSPVSSGLRRFPDGGELIDLTSLSNLSPLSDDDMRANLRPLIDGDSLFNHRVGTDIDIFPNFSFWGESFFVS